VHMGLDVWFREDVARVLRAAWVAGRAACAGLSQADGVAGGQAGVLSREMAAYWRGYEAALATMGAAFGLAGIGEVVEVEELRVGFGHRAGGGI
jgi:hypothetical protein